MRPVSAASARRAGWLLASASVATLISSSNASAGCTLNVPGGQVLALSGDTCNVVGSYATAANDAIAGQATGLNALITGPNNAGLVTFSTTGVSTNGLQADNGGQIILTEGAVATTGNGSQGLLADGAGSTLQASNLSVTTSGATDAATGNRAYAVLVESGGQITITGSSAATTGDSSYVAGIIAGGALSLAGTTISSTGPGSGGVFINGTGGTLNATGVTITTAGGVDPSTGFSAVGAYNGSYPGYPQGGTMTFTGSTITTSGFEADGIDTESGGRTTINGGSVSTSGANTSGLYATDAGSTVTTNTPVGLAGVAITTSGANSEGVQADSGAQMTLNGGSVAVTGQDSEGVVSTGGSTTNLNDTTVTMTGIGSKGLQVSGGATLNSTGVTVTTSGDYDAANNYGAQGVFNAPSFGYATAGTVNLSNSTVSTGGFEANAVLTRGGTTTITGGSYSTSGSLADVILGQGAGTSVSVSGATIIATGLGTPGVTLVGSGSTMTLLNDTIKTSGQPYEAGRNAVGVFNGTSASGNYVGGGVLEIVNSSITTSGASANGVSTENGGSTSISGGSINTTGNAAYAVTASNGGLTSLNGTAIGTTGNGSGGLGINGAGSEIDASGVSIATTGGMDPATGLHSYGVYNGPYGDLASGGVANLADMTISTQGAAMYGVLTSTGGSTTISGGSVTTSGAGAYAIAVNGGGAVTLNGTTISTSANGAGGFSVAGAGSTLTASGVSITTQGGFDPASGDHSYGLYNGPSGSFAAGGVATLTDTTISTQGAEMHGVVTAAGGSTTLIGTNLSTAGPGANGVFTNAGGVTNINGGSVNTVGQDAHAVFVTGFGSQGNLSGAGAFATTGAGAIGLYAALGGAISATGSTMTTIATSGGVSLATGLGAYGVNADGAGSSINLGSATITTSGAGATGLYASDRAGSGAGGTISAVGTLNVETKNASAAAIALQGNGAAINATGGGTISSAGTAIAFLGGTGQSATFDNFAIGNLSGDLVFADPSVATLNFNNTNANAGNNNLLNATAGSAITLNANASTLTGAIRTDATSTTNVNLTNNTIWSLTAASTVSNLNVTHSIIAFAPPGANGAFKTLTVNNYAGNGANITMNVALSGASSASDQIIINGGHATGSTLLTINNVGGLGGQTSGAGIPLVVATNGGSVSPGAFALANTPIAGGYKYTLEETDNSYFLVSSPTATIADLTNSVNNVAKAQQSQMITNRVLGSLLLGATQQISCSSCGGGFASVGSFALGGSGRWSLSDTTTLIGGISYDQWSASGISVTNAPTVAGALVYDFVHWGSSRPFVEAGLGLTPYEQVNYSRTYANGTTSGYGYASATNRNASLFGRVGWVDRLTSIDEAAAYVDLGRSWMQTGGYGEQMTAINPFPATVPNGLAALNTTRLGAQYTHLFNGNIEVNVGGALAYGFGAGAGAPFNISQFGTIAPGAIADSAWFEYGARVGYRMTDRLVVDAFVLGTAGGLAGNFVHGGVGVRYSF
jgi:fibronectin-binding autotransporter adhesin